MLHLRTHYRNTDSFLRKYNSRPNAVPGYTQHTVTVTPLVYPLPPPPCVKLLSYRETSCQTYPLLVYKLTKFYILKPSTNQPFSVTFEWDEFDNKQGQFSVLFFDAFLRKLSIISLMFSQNYSGITFTYVKFDEKHGDATSELSRVECSRVWFKCWVQITPGDSENCDNSILTIDSDSATPKTALAALCPFV